MKLFSTLLFSATLLAPCALQAQITFSNYTHLIPTQGIQTDHPIAILDMNGDNKDDIVLLADGESLYIEFQNAAGAAFTEYDHPGSGGQGGAWGMCGADVDNDGFADILYGGAYNDLTVVTTNTVEIDYATANLGESLFLQGVNFGDIDNDGNLDIFACDDDGESRIYIGDGAGGFTEDATIIVTNLNGGGENDSGNYGSCFTDIDNDGDIDMYVAKCRQGVSNSSDPRRINILFINNGDGTWTEDAASWGIDVGEQSWSADFNDIDNDGDMDLMFGQHTGEPVALYENNGNGTFTDITISAGLVGAFQSQVIQTKFADFDNDGWIDMYASGTGEHVMYWNNGDKTFNTSNQPGIGCEVNSFALGDLNDDGFMDMYATSHGYGSWTPTGDDSLYFNDGNSNNYMTVSLEGVLSNPDAVGARVYIHGSFGTQMREVRSGESYGIQNSLNCYFGIGTATAIDSVVIAWPAGGVQTHTNPAINGTTVYVESVFISTTDVDANTLEVSVFPNPAVDQAMISINGDISNRALTLNIFDITGNVVRSESNLQLNNILLNRNDLANGLYFFELTSNDGFSYSGKIVFK
jgi:hypothetical protein